MRNVIRARLRPIGKDGKILGARVGVHCLHCGRLFPATVRYQFGGPTVYCTFCYGPNRLRLIWDPPEIGGRDR